MSPLPLTRTLVGLLSLVSLLHASAAFACTYAIVVIESSYPESGATDVPTNSVPFVYGPELDSAGDVELVDDQGQVVPVEVRAVTPSGWDLVPQSDLLPERRYELRRVGQGQTYGASVEFTTGSGPAEVPATLDKPTLDARALVYQAGTCGEQNGLCLDVSQAANTTLEVRIGEEVLRNQSTEANWPRHRAYGGPLEAEDCIDVRRRDVRGNRSEPAVTCGGAIERLRLSNEGPDSGYTCDNYEDFVESNGCAVRPGRPARLGYGWLAVVGAAWPLSRRRRVR